MVKQKFYVVFIGRERGVFNTWQECKNQIAGFPKASFASFKTRQAAGRAFAMGDLKQWRVVESKETLDNWRKAIVGPCLAVDAACSGCPGPVEYRGVMLPDVVEVFKCGPYNNGTNNIGEFLAIVTGLRWMEERSLTLLLYSYSKTTIGWVVGDKKCNTTICDIGDILKMEIRKAESWLRGPTAAYYVKRVLKWDTQTLGEIPADFGRK